MDDPGAKGWLARFRDLPNDAPAKTLALAFAVAVVCAVVVSTSAVLLRPLQKANEQAARPAQIIAIIANAPGYDARGLTVEARVIELATGLDDPSKEPSTFDPRAASSDPAASEVLASGDDLARIGRRARHATVYLVKRKRDLVLVILPVYGLGYASMLHGFLALEPDGETVVSLSIYEHKETPGLGAKIDDPAWQALWLGKKVRDEQGVLRVGVAKGPAAQEDAPYQVDGISGATRTGRGITNALRFWLGKHGFEPFLQRLKSGEFRS